MVIYLLVCDNSKCLLQTRIVNFTVKLNCVFVETLSLNATTTFIRHCDEILLKCLS